MTAKKSKIDLGKALLDPPSVFASPEDLLEEPSLAKSQKIDLLKRWKFDAQRVLDSASEGFSPETGSNLLQRITLALESLEQTG